ncbi:hypothetical protein [Bacillus sp. B-jedd]|uniref:hypothetical protein n=1 Tax=Bacillus sp. B-jedd TaxID=1476857 RepID=UPI0005156E35|nr:hypothetical protein [Bacillus sp. B-jedd]CEG27173.1 hypothetical protein BN1002_02029 [Bacillus sp. B-jedd]
MSAQMVVCEKCAGVIKNRDDLVTAVLIYAVVPYHESCYAKDLKGAKTFFLDNQPLNGFSGNLIFILSIIIAFLWLLFADSKWYSIIALLPIGYRIYSYFIYEIHTKSK